MVQIGDAAGSLGPLLFLFWPATGPPASALDQYFEITNTSGLPIVELHAARPGSGDWDEDLLGQDYLQPGYSVVVTIEDGSGCCPVRHQSRL